MLFWEKFVLQTVMLTMLKWRCCLAAIFSCCVCWQSNILQLKMIRGMVIILVILNEIMGIVALKSMRSMSENISENCVQL